MLWPCSLRKSTACIEIIVDSMVAFVQTCNRWFLHDFHQSCRMSKIRRKVTVENSKTISDSSSTTASSSTNNPAAPSRRPSVFERLGPSTGSNAADVCTTQIVVCHFCAVHCDESYEMLICVFQSHCRNWLKTGNCSYGNTCRYTHGTHPRGKGFNFSRYDALFLSRLKN